MNKNRIISVVCAVLVLFALTVTVSANEIPSERLRPRVVDEAGLIDDDTLQILNLQFNEVSEKHKVDVVAVIVNDTNGQYIRDFADDYFDYNGFGYGASADGVVLVVDMSSREWWISTCGYGITAFTDAGIDYLGNELVYYMSDGDFGSAFAVFAELADDFITQAKAGVPYDTGTLPKAPITIMHFIIPIIIGCIIGFIATGSLKSQLNSVRPQRAAHSYVKAGSMEVTESRDMYLYRNVTRVKKETESGGSSTHRSSSGRSHGGGGGKF